MTDRLRAGTPHPALRATFRVAIIDCFPLWLQGPHCGPCLTRRAPSKKGATSLALERCVREHAEAMHARQGVRDMWLCHAIYTPNGVRDMSIRTRYVAYGNACAQRRAGTSFRVAACGVIEESHRVCNPYLGDPSTRKGNPFLLRVTTSARTCAEREHNERTPPS